jgi:hypothetical protein
MKAVASSNLRSLRMLVSWEVAIHCRGQHRELFQVGNMLCEDFRICRFNLDAGADSGKRNIFGAVSPSTAVSIAEYPINNDADFCIKDKKGIVVLTSGARTGNFDGAENLVRNRTNILAKFPMGIMSLHTAAINYHTRIKAVLLNQRAEIDIRLSDGKMPFIALVWNGRIITIALLIPKEMEEKAKKFSPHNSLEESRFVRSACWHRCENNEHYDKRSYTPRSGLGCLTWPVLQGEQVFPARRATMQRRFHGAKTTGQKKNTLLLV